MKTLISSLFILFSLSTYSENLSNNSTSNSIKTPIYATARVVTPLSIELDNSDGVNGGEDTLDFDIIVQGEEKKALYPASITITGEINRHVSITIPNKITLNGPSNSHMNAHLFVENEEKEPINLNEFELKKSKNKILIDGSIKASLDQTPGDYNGMINVTIKYN